MNYIKVICILIMVFIFSSCKGFNYYLIMNSDCNCKNYIIDQEKYKISFWGVYDLSDIIFSTLVIEISNKTNKPLLFNSKENELISQNLVFEARSGESVIEIPPKTNITLDLYFRAKFKDPNVFSDKDEQILKIKGLMDSRGKIIEIEDIRLVTTTWNY